ncbi:MAG: mannose-6-phosphate isomerase, class I [Thermodesulfobacteriota bacterium]|nr:mannose-6-phosphate isomerase, class I [Thermodesulfobacteriota bacterium]
MNRISILENPVMEYVWGSGTAIQSLLGQPESVGKPLAELWMGAHPKAPSKVLVDEGLKRLDEVIERDPESILGEDIARRFSSKLPFLFKLLAAETPLSLQVHPNLKQAQAGFARENRLGIPLIAPHRNFRDESHKPELLCALTYFKGLKGFRKINEIMDLMGRVSSSTLSALLGRLRKEPDSRGLERFFTSVMSMEEPSQRLMVSEAVKLAERYAGEDEAFNWMVKLNQEYPGDIGVLSPGILNLVQLVPGEAIYIPPGEPHAYLHGLGIELMAASDNVLRCALTTKHVHIQELLKIISFEIEPLRIMRPLSDGPCQRTYSTPAEEFLLSVISVDEGGPFSSPQDRSVEILICLTGEADIIELSTGQPLRMTRGKSVIVPSLISRYRIEGNATLYKASVPALTRDL